MSEPLHSRPVVAAFDVDHTVTRRDCVVPFMRRVAGTPRVVGTFGRTAVCNVPALLRRDRDHLKGAMAHAVFAGRPMVDVERLGEAFADRIATDGLRDDVMARVRWHHERGHDVVLVSASFGAYLRPLARRLGVVTDVLCTDLAVDEAGRCSGELVDGNCRGPAKVRRLHAWLDEHRGGRAAVVLWAYGDSSGDRELLADADHPVRTHSAVGALEPAP